MAGTKKYNRIPEKYNQDSDKYLHIHKDGGIPIKVGKDGKVYARGFVDTNDEIEFSVENGTVRCIHTDQETKNYKISHDIPSVPFYTFSLAFYDVLDQSFQNYVYPNKFYDYKTIPTYTRLHRTTRGLIDSAVNNLSTPTYFHHKYFTKNNHRYVEPTIQGTWLGPYNYDVMLKTEGPVQKMQDLVVVKSGKFKKQSDEAEMEYGVKSVLFTTGVSGHVHVESLSVPQHVYKPGAGLNVKSFKFKNSGHSQLSEDVTPTSIGSGAIGILKNGVFVHSPLNGKHYRDSGKWYEDSVVTESSRVDDCWGDIQHHTTIENFGVYNYKTAPVCIYSVDETSHSPLLGFAKDGFPIYGPVAYSGAGNTSSPLKVLQPSYRLKQASSRVEGPDFDSVYVSGYYAQDYEYVNDLGDLDEHNGRTGITPEFPDGTYAYFTTVDDNYSPKYPYVVGPTYHGNIDGDEGLAGSVTESPLYSRLKPLTPAELAVLYPNSRVNLWEVYGDTHTKNVGLYSEKIIYVSPHVLKEANGVFLKTGELQYYKSDGVTPATYSGNKWTATGNGSFMVEETGYRFPSSDRTLIYKDTALRSGHYLSFINYDGGDTLIPTYAPSSVTGTYFYSAYSGHKQVSGRVDARPWDGVIPAGTPFKVESWAFNGDSIGFNGQLAVIPNIPHPMCSGKVITLVSQATGVGLTTAEAQKNAKAFATKDLLRKNNTLLINSGIKSQNAKMRRWKTLKEKQTNT